MAVLIEAKGSKRDGTAYFPDESKQRMPVEVVDRRWLSQHWNEIKRTLSRVENSRFRDLLRLKQAIEGKSSNLETAAGAVIGLSEPDQKVMDRLTAADFKPMIPGVIYRKSPSPLLFSLRQEPRALAAAELTLSLSRVKPCLWLDNKEQRQFGLFCPDLLSAIYAITSTGFGIAACLRCGGLFLRDRADNQFCSSRCQNTYLTAKRRRRKRDLSAVRKRSKRQASRVARKRRQRAA